jgi:threonine synthase
MRYISTRSNAPSVSFSDALLAGLAPDGGLYVPEHYPQFTWMDVIKMRGWSYNRIALEVLGKFIGGDIPHDDLEMIVAKSYTARKFGSLDITPIRPLAKGVGLLQLSNGPTLAFKDVALQLVANLMDYVLEKRGEELTILGATSGDTGSSAAYAVMGKERLRLFMLSPKGRMSEFQRKQMYTIHDDRIHNIAVAGTFDDCQNAVKLVSEDLLFKDKHHIGALNSINWGRILAQVIYWVYGFVRTVRSPDEFLTAAVPSGNFGNALSAYIASKMGLRIRTIVCTNVNDVLHDFFTTGVYRVRKREEVKITSSPSMDIAQASNLERFVFDFLGRDGPRLENAWQELKTTGRLKLMSNYPGEWAHIQSGRATELDVLHWIKLMYDLYWVVIDPHTAVAAKVGFDLYAGPGLGPMLIAETAQPVKFLDTVNKALGQRLQLAPHYQDLFNGEEYFTPVEDSEPEAIAEKVKQLIDAH